MSVLLLFFRITSEQLREMKNSQIPSLMKLKSPVIWNHSIWGRAAKSSETPRSVERCWERNLKAADFRKTCQSLVLQSHWHILGWGVWWLMGLDVRSNGRSFPRDTLMWKRNKIDRLKGITETCHFCKSQEDQDKERKLAFSTTPKLPISFD